MESERKQLLEKSGWVKVDDGTYQLKQDVERLSASTDSSSLSFFLGLVKAAARPDKNE
jgi:hypothetical protein